MPVVPFPGHIRRTDFHTHFGRTGGSVVDSVIWGMSQLPLVTLAVASLAVVNTIVTSTRMRWWEMGVLRSQGMTRLGLVRLVLAEAILIGLA